MPARPSHIPHAVERATLQKMSAAEALPLEKLHPAGKQTVAGMLAKGWIERRSNDRGRLGYCITAVGQEAMKVKIPDRRWAGFLQPTKTSSSSAGVRSVIHQASLAKSDHRNQGNAGNEFIVDNI
jgi:hypothetical protein